MSETTTPSGWQTFWAKTKTIAIKVAAVVPAILLVVGALVLVALGMKNIQIGGLLGKLFGKEGSPGKKALDVANSIPKDRVDANGNLIPLGQPDSKGIVQAQVVPIELPNIFDDPSKVKIVPPGETKPIVVDLPDGVKASDVDKVIVVQTEVRAVSVKDSSSVTPQDVDDLLAKYGK